MQEDAENFLSTFVAWMSALQHEKGHLSDDELEPILLKYAQKADFTAILLLEKRGEDQLICTKSTLSLYDKKNFGTYFPKGVFEKQGVQIFLAEDPIFGHSLFVSLRIPDQLDSKKAMAVVSISLEKVIERLNQRRTIFEMNLGVVSKDFTILTSTDPMLQSRHLEILEKGSKPSSTLKKRGIELVETRTVKNGYKYYLAGKKRFCVLGRLPNTQAFLFTSVPSSILLSKMTEQLVHLGIFLACVLVFGGIAAFLFTLRISKPLIQLSKVMTSVGEGQLEKRFVRDQMGFEINFLGEKFNQMVTSLITYIEEVKIERASKEAYAKELQIGHEIQQSILPKTDTQFPGIDVAVYFKPAKEVAGDFFDWLIKDEKVLITIADGVGKGVSSALYSFDLRSILRSFATTHNELSEIVLKTNSLFCQDTKESGNFVTAFLALYNNENKSVQYANCGHNYPYIRRASGEVIALKAKGIAFGVDEITQVDVQSVNLEKGDFFVLFTDGITDAQNKADELYTEKRLMEVLQTAQHDNPQALLNNIIQAIESFTGGADQYDDMTLIVLKIKD